MRVFGSAIERSRLLLSRRPSEYCPRDSAQLTAHLTLLRNTSATWVFPFIALLVGVQSGL